MGIFFVFILKSSFCLVIFYITYKVLLSKNTFYGCNRFLLLGIYTLAILLPLIKVKMPESSRIPAPVISWEKVIPAEENTYNYFVSVAPDDTLTPVRIDWTDILLLIYVAGIAFIFLRYLYSFLHILLILRGSKKTLLYSCYKLIIHSKNIAPFSWMTYIIISETDLKEEGDAILIHELAHIKKCHFLDLVIAEVFIIIQWFNPIAWFMRHELKNIHEFEADEVVLNSGIDAKLYQLLLIKKAVGSQRFNSMTNSFNHSKLNKRITMMLKEKSNSWNRLKYLFVIPMAGLTIAAFAHPEVSQKADDLSKAEVNTIVSIINKQTEENAQENRTYSDGQQSIQKTDSVIKPDKTRNPALLDKKNYPLIIIDGKEVGYDEFIKKDTISANTIKFWPPEEAMRRYGDKGQNGAYYYYIEEECIEKEISFDWESRVSIPMKMTKGVTENVFDNLQVVNLRTERINRKNPDILFRDNMLLVKDIADDYIEILSYENMAEVKIRLNGKDITKDEFNGKIGLEVEKISLPQNGMPKNGFIIDIEAKQP